MIGIRWYCSADSIFAHREISIFERFFLPRFNDYIHDPCVLVYHFRSKFEHAQLNKNAGFKRNNFVLWLFAKTVNVNCKWIHLCLFVKSKFFYFCDLFTFKTAKMAHKMFVKIRELVLKIIVFFFFWILFSLQFYIIFLLYKVILCTYV